METAYRFKGELQQRCRAYAFREYDRKERRTRVGGVAVAECGMFDRILKGPWRAAGRVSARFARRDGLRASSAAVTAAKS